MKDNREKKALRAGSFTSGPVLGRLILFALPLMASGVLQLLYNAFDMIIVGKYDSSSALAAVGATGPLINLIIGVFMGISLGSSVVVAQYVGAKSEREVGETVHTSMLVAMLSGVVLCVIGVLAARPMLQWMDTPDDVIDKAVLYMRIYFTGVPVSLVYNFGSAIMRGAGDSKRPLIFLSISGIVNIALNYVLVKYLYMGVAGVAIATVVSQVISALMVTISLSRREDCCRLRLRELHIYRDKLGRILRIGVPSGVQSALFSISNVLIQSAINSFGATAMAGHTAACSIEGFINASVTGVSQAGVTFTGQNTGAGKPKRVARIAIITTVIGVLLAVSMGMVGLSYGRELLGIYTEEPAVVDYGLIRFRMICHTFWLWALMDIYSGQLRGTGHSTAPMIISIMGICVLRVIWLYTAFVQYPTLRCLYISYPVSWGITWLVQMIWFWVSWRRGLRQHNAQTAAAPQC
ncbi:MAG: MATE family efflux transporter [Ruminococcaceae bacterium]|nr:MATE family efflux transporter [Oscillospiraceae bacterium]